MKKTLLTLLFLVAILPQVKAQTFESAREAVEHMRVGWNLGNTLDSNSGDTLHMWIEANKSRTVTSYETAWGQKVTQPSLFKMFREAGFNAIRVPVTWYPHMEATFNSVRGYSDKGTWTYTPWLPSKDDIGTQVQKAWMQRVHEVVDYVIDQGMYCILNIHHDTGASNTAWLIADEDVYAAQHERFEAIWKQIAEEFRDYDEHLLFEGYNEMLDVKRSWCFASFASDSRYDAAIARSAYNAINAYAQSFVDVVRATGGNNAQRNLIVSTYGACDGGGTWNSHLQDPQKQMKLPTDAAKDHLIFEVHSYPNASNINEAKNYVTTTIARLKSNLESKGAPVIFGEWGTTGDNLSMATRVEFVKHFAQSCKDNGIGLFYWMGLSDGSHRTVPEWSEPELVEAMMEGFYGEGGYSDGIEMVQLNDSELNGRSAASSRIYDLSGRPSTLRRGIQIVGGRKVFVK